MKKEMLINVLQPEECRIAIVEDGVLEELYVERTSHESYVGNIYKGRIVNIEPSIQAAFVDFGVGRNGFLHVSDVEPAYYRHLEEGREGGGRRASGRDRHRGEPRQERRPRRENRMEEEPTAVEIGEGPVSPAEALPEAEYLREAEVLGETTSETEAPAARQENERGRGRRSSGRGRSRRGRREEAAAEPVEISEAAEPAISENAPAAEPIAQTPAPSEATEPPPQPTSEPEHPPQPEQGPRFMGSAERRTEEGGSGVGPLEPKPSYSEADLFFPRSEPTESAPEPAEPAHVPEPDVPELTESWPELTAHAETVEPELEPEERPFEEPEFEERGMESEALEEMGEFPEFDEADFEPRQPRRRNGRGERRGRGDRGRRNGYRRGPGRPGMGRPKPLIQDIFKRGQEVLVQVIKEGIGTKGPTLSTYISIAGRYLVLMPGLNRIGVSRKIVDEEQRRRLREILTELQPPKGLGFIIRTAGLDKTKKELQRDLAYLSRLWQVVVRRIRKMKSPAEIYRESDMITRTIRDTFTAEIETIWVDEPEAFEHAQEFLQIVMPRYANRIKLYSGPEPMFHKYGIENEIARIQQRHVPLPNGGSIVIDQTEALVAIDVNSGNFRADNNAEETAYQMNLLAAKEIARQLRLRDLGGVIVNDFIDMRDEKHRRGVERALREAVKRDRARTKVLKISAFGLIEMTRQRIRPSLKRSVYQDCSHCAGTGQVKTCESMSIDVMRMLQLATHAKQVSRIEVRVADEVAHYLLNKKRKEIARLEETGTTQVFVTGLPGAAPETLEFTCYDNNNNEVKFLPHEEAEMRRR
jgi:ribonuclease E